MKIILKARATGSYFVGEDIWTNNPDDARGFDSTQQAVQFWEEHHLPPTTVVMKADDGQHDVVVADCPQSPPESSGPG